MFGDGFTAPQHTVGPRRNATFLARVVIRAEQVVLVRGREQRLAFVEAEKHLQRHLPRDE